MPYSLHGRGFTMGVMLQLPTPKDANLVMPLHEAFTISFPACSEGKQLNATNLCYCYMQKICKVQLILMILSVRILQQQMWGGIKEVFLRLKPQFCLTEFDFGQITCCHLVQHSLSNTGQPIPLGSLYIKTIT